jgi:putative ABC transport system permease protein
MLAIALKMLIGNRASFIGVIFGVFLATLLISQQSAIFLGLVARSYRMITDIPAPNIWIINPLTESDEKAKDIPIGYLDIIRSIPGIEWAEPIGVAQLPLQTSTGAFHIGKINGLDDASLMGAPVDLLQGHIQDLHREGAVIIDLDSANDTLAKTLSNGTKVPLQIGDAFEINNQRAVIVGISRITPGFYPQPIIFTALNQFKKFTSDPSGEVKFIAAKAKESDVENVLSTINKYNVLYGLTTDQLDWRIAKSFLKTGILINFGLSVILGIIIGFSISGQIFYTMTLQNMKYYALIKSLGGNQRMISSMIVFQVAIVGIIGFLFGTAATILWGFAVDGTTLAFWFPWHLLLFTAFIALIICIFTAGLSIRKIFNADPKMLMGD